MTILIIICALIILAALVRGLYLARKWNYLGLFVISIFIIIGVTIAAIISVNTDNTITSGIEVTPAVKVRTIEKNNSVVSSDTTYIYVFDKDK